jgi:hypothetical protein
LSFKDADGVVHQQTTKTVEVQSESCGCEEGEVATTE